MIDDMQKVLAMIAPRVQISDSESENDFGEDQDTTKSAYLYSSNLDDKLIQLLLDDWEFKDQMGEQQHQLQQLLDPQDFLQTSPLSGARNLI